MGACPCPCYWGCGTWSNRAVWGIIAFLAALGLGMVLGAAISGADCLSAYQSCRSGSDQTASQCQDAGNRQCGLEVYQSLVAAGAIILVFGLPALMAYFCCCSSPPPPPPSDLEGPYHIVVLHPPLPLAPPAARQCHAPWQTGAWEELQRQVVHAHAHDHHQQQQDEEEEEEYEEVGGLPLRANSQPCKAATGNVRDCDCGSGECGAGAGDKAVEGGEAEGGKAEGGKAEGGEGGPATIRMTTVTTPSVWQEAPGGPGEGRAEPSLQMHHPQQQHQQQQQQQCSATGPRGHQGWRSWR